MSFLFRGQRDKADKASKASQSTGPRTKQPILTLNHELSTMTSRPTKPVNDEQVQQLKEFVAEHRRSHPCDPSYASYEEAWLKDIDVYKRYLRATNNDIKSSKRRIIDTLQWRRDFRPEIIPPDEVAPEATSGKHVLSGFDLEGRPILYLRPGRENTKASPRQIRYMVWSLERGINLMPPGQETLTIIVDFHGASMSTMPSLSTARHVAHILQNHYVERLGRALVCHMPRFISAFFSALSPFLDPVTKDKIRFNEANMTQFIRSDQLDDQFPGGSYPFEFDFSVYWPALIKACGIQPDGSRKTLQT